MQHSVMLLINFLDARKFSKMAFQDLSCDIQVLTSLPPWTPWFENALNSTTIKQQIPTEMTEQDLPQHILELIDECMIYYDKLYAVKMTI